jgi:hypothetical protein
VEFAPAEQPSLVPPVPPEGLGTVLYDSDERDARADLRRQIAAMEAELGQLFASAFPRRGIEFGVPAPGGGPRILTVNELERLRDSIASRVQQVKGVLHEHSTAEEANRLLIEEMTADPESYKWVRVSNEDIGEPGCRHWHSRPRWGLLGMIIGWWRVIVSSGCPLAAGLAAPQPTQPTEWRRNGSASGAAPGPRPGSSPSPRP